MGKPLRNHMILLLCLSFLFIGGLPGSADSTLEETRKLLQKSLTLFELDQEISRLSEQEIRIGSDIVQTEAQITENQTEVSVTRQHAGKVLRAYYMGERDNMWMLLFSARSLSEAFAIYEYMNMILGNDQRTLHAYADSYEKLTESKSRLEADRLELIEVKNAFIAQREKALAVQKEIDEQLAASAQAEALRAEMDRFTKEWQEKGVPLFRKYMSSMSGAMKSITELLNEDAGKYFKVETLKSGSFVISDSDLLRFFRSKNELFQNMELHFENETFMAFGKEGDIEVAIEGRYTVENEPENHLRFHVDRLTYNGFVLPESSNRALEDEFDLGFSPGKYLKNAQVTEVTLKDGMLRLKLKL